MFDNTTFKASDNWLQRFRFRYAIAFKRIHGESADIDTNALQEWQHNILQPTIERYEPSQIYNLDETGLFFQLLPDRTMAFKGKSRGLGSGRVGMGYELARGDTIIFFCKCDYILGEKCSAGKHSKVRITVLVGTNMTGSDKLPLLTIGKSSRPRCFKGQSIPLDYRSNNRAWMTSMLWDGGGGVDSKRIKEE